MANVLSKDVQAVLRRNAYDFTRSVLPYLLSSFE